VDSLIVTKVKLHNWQGYHGTSEFNFHGTTDKTSAFIYADNTVGKTAFWEAFQFALYGVVERRGMPNTFRPMIKEDSGDHPLLNTDEFGKVGAKFFVEVHFSHDGSNYRLYRGMKPRFENTPVKLPNHLLPDVNLENRSEMGANRHISNEDRWIKENILPNRLSKFFLFDGERLEEYEDLMTKDEDIDLRNDIDNIIRTPILSEGVSTFKKSESRFRVKQGKAQAAIEQNKKRVKEFEKLSKHLKEAEASLKKLRAEKKDLQKKVDEIEQWLRDNDKTKEAAIRLDGIKSQIENAKKAEKGFRADIIREMKGAWKIIISPMVNQSKQMLSKEEKAQKKHIMQMARIEENIKHLGHEMEGEPCTSCKRPRKSPTSERKKEIETEMSKLHSDFDKHKENSRYPTHEQFHMRNMALNSLNSNESELTVLFEKETALMDEKKKLKKAEKDKERQLEHISEEKNQLVRAKLTEQKSIKVKLEQHSIDEGAVLMSIDGYREELKEFTDSSKKDSKESAKIKKLRKSTEISEALKQVFDSSLKEFREKMREKVEKRATNTFLRISNNRDNYKGLKITDKYAVSIINKKGKRDAGSQAQSLVMAYSIIEALSSCSGFEFPMVIDTPGRGLAKSNVSSVYDFFIDSDRQVIFLPNDLELDPEEGDRRYGKKVAATYELVKIDDDRTEVVPREVGNLR
jgi:DNA sulfur modification protein DndD